MRLFVLRLLLMAVFFNTTIGMPSHGASHIRQAADMARAFVALDACEDPAQAGGTAGAQTAEDAEAVCAWCLGHAPHAAALLPHPGLPLVAAALPERAPPRAVPGAIPAQNRWAFASRDPPR